MSRSIHFTSKSIAVYGTPDCKRLPYSRVSGRTVCLSLNSSRGDYTLISDVKFSSLRCPSRLISTVCNASSSNYKRNSDFSRQNRRGFSRNRNRFNEEKEGCEDLEEFETLPSKNGPLLSVSGNQKFQATATPGPREKEIVELFKKVQAQLRERAAMKEEKKVEDSPEKSKESETVDSLLKLLRKHSVQQGKKNTNSAGNRDFILDNYEKTDPSTEEIGGTNISDSNGIGAHDVQESTRSYPGRPKSDFRKRSPVPEIKFQPVYPEGSVNSVTPGNVGRRRKGIGLEPEVDGINEVKIESVTEEAHFSEGDVFDDGMPDEDETSEIYESDDDDDDDDDDEADEPDPVEASSLSGMKLTELRALAKSRGMKGFSKLKKNELIELLTGSLN